MNDVVSVIVPIYNVENYIHRCLDSIIEQNYSNLEIILVDDGSQDKSGLICEDYVKRDSRIKVIHKKNEGLGFARNSGLDIASGKYVTFIDGDDYIGKLHIEQMVSLIEKTGTDTCMGGYTKVYKNRNISHKNIFNGLVIKENIKDRILPRMCGADEKGNDFIEMSVCMVLFSNEVIKKNHIRFVSEREFVSEDLMFNFNYYPLSKGVCISNIDDYFYCDNQGSLTTKYRIDRFTSQIKLYDYLFEKAKRLGIEKECKNRLQNTVIAIARYSVKLEYKFAKENTMKIARKRVKNICCNSTLENIFEEYNDRGIKYSSRAVNFLIKNKRYNMLYLTMKVKNIFNI